MKINFNQSFKQIGSEEPLPNPESKEPFILKDAALAALLAPEEKQTGEVKAKQWVLATRIYANPEDIDLTVEEISKIKELIGKGYGPLIVGQAWEMLENK